MHNQFNRVGFIGRVEELAQVKEAIEAEQTQKIISIKGMGGIGKTRFLEEIYTRFSPYHTLCKIIDFDNSYFAIQGTIITHIAKELSTKEYFQEFFEVKKDYERAEKELNVSDLTLKAHNETLNRLFVKEFNLFSQNRRVVIIFDTLDKLDTKAIPYIAKLIGRLKNSLFLIAGRSDNLNRIIPMLSPTNLHQMTLKQFSTNEIENYIQQKRINSAINVKPSTEQKIAILSRGKPILIDLAIDRIGVKDSIEWLGGYSVDDIMFANRMQKEQLESKFEENLISDIVKADTKIDEYILLLSLIRQANKQEIEEILELDETQRDNIFEYSKNSVIFKNIGNTEVALHDEISRMLDSYIRKKGTFSKCEQFIGQSIAVLERELVEKVNSSHYRAFIKQRLLRLKLYHDISVGTEYFIQVFDEEFESGILFKYIKPLIDNIEPYIEEIPSAELKSRVIVKIAHYYLKDGQYDKTYTLMRKEYSQELSGENQVNLLLSLINAKIRIGKFDEAIKASKEAITISRQVANRQLEAQALNILGWTYRHHGELSKAIAYYLKANQLIEDFHEPSKGLILQGWIHNNLAFAYAQKGNIQSATKLAEIAQRIWTKIGYQTGLGALYEVYGEIHLKYGNYAHAITYYNKALNIFIEKGDKDFSKRAFVEKAAAHIYANNLSQAKKDLEYATDIYIDISSLDVRLEFERASIALHEERFEDALSAIKKSISIHEFHPNPEYLLLNLYLKLTIAIKTLTYEQEQTIREELSRFKQMYPDANYPLAEAIIFKRFGDLALLRGAHIEYVLKWYKDAFMNFKLYGESEPYSVYRQLSDINRLFIEHTVSTEMIRAIGQSLCHYWEENAIDETYPETLYMLSFWREGKAEGA